jgi:hypothetical protein
MPIARVGSKHRTFKNGQDDEPRTDVPGGEIGTGPAAMTSVPRQHASIAAAATVGHHARNTGA